MGKDKQNQDEAKASEIKKKKQKWDQDATPSDKVLSLASLLLFNNCYYSLKELSENLKASKPTALRALQTLERMNFGQISRIQKGRQAYFKLERLERTPRINLNAEGLRQLALCRDFMLNLLPEQMRLALGNTLNQAVQVLPEQNQGLPPALGVSLVKGSIDYAPFQDIFDRLMDAAEKRLVCNIEYKSPGNADPKRHAFAPQRLLSYNGCFYSEGWLVSNEDPVRRKYDDVQRLPIQRFLACELTKRSSASLPEIPLPDNEAMGLMNSQWLEPVRIKVKFSPPAAAYVAERRWSQNQEIENLPDGCIVLSANMANDMECIAWLLGFGPQATLLEPGWLVRDLKKALRETLGNYPARGKRQPVE